MEIRRLLIVLLRQLLEWLPGHLTGLPKYLKGIKGMRNMIQKIAYSWWQRVLVHRALMVLPERVRFFVVSKIPTKLVCFLGVHTRPHFYWGHGVGGWFCMHCGKRYETKLEAEYQKEHEGSEVI